MESFSTFFASDALYASHREPVAPDGGLWNFRSNSHLNRSSMRTERHCFSICHARPFSASLGEESFQPTASPAKARKRTGAFAFLNSIAGCIQR